MTSEQFLEQLRDRFGAALSEAEVKGPVLLLTTTADQGYAVCQALHDLGFEYLNCLSGVDWTTHLEVVYDLSSLHHATKAHLRVKVDRADPLVRSVAVLWKAANWHERECYDMFGVRFDGHPDHRRILLSEDWVGFPLRKDYTDERLVPYTDYGLEEKQAKTEAGKGAPKPAPAAPKPPAPPKPPASAG